MSFKLSELREEYEELFKTCKINKEQQPDIDAIIARITRHQARYAALAEDLGIPWYFIALIHQLEASGDFDCHLHNGDPLDDRTVRQPPGRPPKGRPPFTWEESAVDALKFKGFDQWTDWSWAGMLYKLESYNGFGYRKYHPEVLSPYLWSFSNHYTSGKYIRDGEFSSTAVSKQIGTAVILRRMVDQGLIALASLIPEPAAPAVQPTPPEPAAPPPTTTYTVRKGDNLWKIATRFGLTLDDLLEANPQIEDKNLIFPGQKIHIPQTWEELAPATPVEGTPEPQVPTPVVTTYIIRAGDNLGQIAACYGISLDELLRLNPQLINPGMVIHVPGEMPGKTTIHAEVVPKQEAPWYEIAEREMDTGIEEIPGPEDNPRIVEYHQSTTLKATDDETPWCSAFVNWCMEQAGIRGTGSARAISWNDWGLELEEPRRGAIAVFEHHVGFYVEDDGNRIRLLGGNQSDAINISRYRKNAVLSYRWPKQT